MSVYLRGGVYWVRYTPAGSKKQVRKSAKTASLAEAVEFERTLKAAAPARKRGGGLRVEELLDLVTEDYRLKARKSLHDVSTQIRLHLLPFFGGQLAVSISDAQVKQYIAFRLGQQAKPATINRELATLKRGFALAEGRIAIRPKITLLPEDNAREVFFEREEFEALRAKLPEHYRPLVTVFYITGWRLNEVLALRWNQVDFRRGYLRLTSGSTKNKEGRMFPLIPELRAAFEEQRQKWSPGLGPVWLRPDGRPVRNFRKAWATGCLAAGLTERKVRHDFRRTAVRNLEWAGVPRSIAMKMVGHKTEAMYRRYAMVSPNDLEVAGERLCAVLSGCAGEQQATTAQPSTA